jgi:hypothetical protein
MKTDQATQIIKQVIAFWQNNNGEITAFFNKHPNDKYRQQVSPGRNSAIYILGHLITVSDSLFPLFGLGEQRYPELSIFLGSSESKIVHDFTIAELKKNGLRLMKSCFH